MTIDGSTLPVFEFTEPGIPAAEAIEAYERDGVVSLRKAFAEDWIEQLADDVESAVDTIKGEVEALPGSGVEGLATGVAEIRTELTELLAEGRTTLDQIRQLDPADELMAAIESNETCQGLRDEE